MYETIDSRGPVTIPLPAASQLRFRELAGAIKARSAIVWGEHCSECGFPTCYSTCAFYTPRRDLHCRRFVRGIELGNSAGLHLARIRFRKWGKLEGAGPVRLLSKRAAGWMERWDRLLSFMIVRFAPSHTIFARGIRRWNLIKKALLSGPGSERIDAFVLEAWLPPDMPLSLTITFLAAGVTRTGMFQAPVHLQPGYNRITLPHFEISARLDLNGPFLVQIEPVGDAAGREIVLGVVDFVQFCVGSIQQAAARTNAASAAASADNKSGARPRTAKCIVWDLDETIWRGTLAEDGCESLKLDPVAVSTIMELDRRGILQSVASKNDPETALAALRVFKLRDYFLFPQIGWGPKSAAVKRIAELLDIGLDTFVFVDDQAFERGEVGETLPEVTVLPQTEVPTLLTNPLFDVPVTPESAKRRAMYQTEELRHTTFANSDADYVTFLRESLIKLEVLDLAQALEERAYELSQRTNQLNVSGRKYSRDEIRSLMCPSSKYRAYMLRCEDRFGDYGVIGMCVVDEQSARVHAFMMSCRVQRKHVEQSFFAWLAGRFASNKSIGDMEIVYRRTQRNQPIKVMLGGLGFEYRPEDDSRGRFVRSLKEPIAEDDVVQVVDHTTQRLCLMSD